ncbi:MAG: aldolase [Gemmatimonadetes bacterium]|nr:aldolase [Gemmatimonadota bacterium]
MRTNRLRARLLAGKPSSGHFVNIPSPAAVEFMGWLGFDFVIIDCEHGIADYETAEHMIRAAEAAGITPMVRIGLNMQQHIQRYLDGGAQGVQIPLVNSGAEAQSVVASVKYPPQGRRGLATTRASGFGRAHPSMKEYVEIANRETLVCVQIETEKGIENADDIVATEGVDIIFLGPSDLSQAFGLHGQTTHPKVVETIGMLTKKALAAGKQVGTIAASPEAFKHWNDVGAKYLCGNVMWFMASGAQAYMDGIKGLRD